MNRPDELSRCLDSIFEGLEKPDEIIVSDDSSDNQPTQTVIMGYPEIIYQQGPRRGLGPNRNACIRSAKGSHIIFIDDDTCVPVEFFAVVQQLVTASEPKTIITGYEMNHGGGGRWQGEVRKVVPHNPDFWGLQRVPVGSEYRSIVINSTIFPRSLFEQALFDECLRYGCEEVDIALHAISLGYRILYQNALYIHHYPSLINREQYQRFTHASRLYVITKAYWQYEGSISKALAYVLLAPLQLIGSAVRKGDMGAVWGALQATAIACRYLSTRTTQKT
jgi:GT2 family glycosyltransferase